MHGSEMKTTAYLAFVVLGVIWGSNSVRKLFTNFGQPFSTLAQQMTVAWPVGCP